MQSLHKFVCVLCILHIISRSLCIGCSSSILIPCERWNENKNIVYYSMQLLTRSAMFQPVHERTFRIFNWGGEIPSTVQHCINEWQI